MAEAKSFKDLPLLYNKGASSALRANTYPDDARDVIPITHAPNTTEQQDYAVPLSQIGVSTVGTCNTSADTQTKVVDVISGSFPFNTENSDEAIGRNILVKFTNGNIAENPKIKIGKIEAKEIVCIGGTATVGSGCWEAGATMKFTFDGENWLMHSNVASKTESYTILADGTTIYTKPQTDSAINGALANYIEEDINNILSDCNLNATPKSKTKYYRINETTLNIPIVTDIIYNSIRGLLEDANLGAIRLQKLHCWGYGTNYASVSVFFHRTYYWNGTKWVYSNWEKLTTESDLNNTLFFKQVTVTSNVNGAFVSSIGGIKINQIMFAQVNNTETLYVRKGEDFFRLLKRSDNTFAINTEVVLNIAYKYS